MNSKKGKFYTAGKFVEKADYMFITKDSGVLESKKR